MSFFLRERNAPRSETSKGCSKENDTLVFNEISVSRYLLLIGRKSFYPPRSGTDAVNFPAFAFMDGVFRRNSVY